MIQLYPTSFSVSSNILFSVLKNTILMAGTHDIRDVTVNNMVRTEYFEHSIAMGVLVIFMFIDEDRSIDFSRSSYLFLDRNASLNYTLPDDLTPGLYRVFAYDIESDGRLHKGVGYPASRDQFTIAGNSRGEIVN